jgi:hypothetical protein
MPGFDGTGPLGDDPLSGRRGGRKCASNRSNSRTARKAKKYGGDK